MKNSMTKLKAALLAATPLAASLNPSISAAEESVLLRYQPAATQFSLSLESDIRAGEMEQPVAGRKFVMKYESPTQAESGPFRFKLAEAKASYTAHGMNQRLGTKHLLGREFGLEIADEGRALHLSGHQHGAHKDTAHKNMDIDMGPVTDHGFALDEVLAEWLPALPQDPVSQGSKWNTQHDSRTLVGWAWAQGILECDHELVNLKQEAGHQVASVHSNCLSVLSALEGSDQYSGDGTLTRNTQWQFDVTDGRLILLSGEQESNGFSDLPQGNVQIRQLSTISLSSEG